VLRINNKSIHTVENVIFPPHSKKKTPTKLHLTSGKTILKSLQIQYVRAPNSFFCLIRFNVAKFAHILKLFSIIFFAKVYTLKGQCHEIFDPRFFSSIDHP
jgi:hypothetical protein